MNPMEYNPAPFVVGVPRSGTTLLRLMLDAHSLLAMAPTTKFVPVVLDLATETELSPETQRNRFFSTLVESRNWADFHIQKDRFREALYDLPEFTYANGLRCFYKAYANRFGKPRWGEKTAENISCIKPLAELIPEAHLIHIIRDGRDVALSQINARMGAPSFAQRLNSWKTLLSAGRQQGIQCPFYLEVMYEDLVRNPSVVLKKICTFIKLPYEPDMVHYHETADKRMDELCDESPEWTKKRRLEAHERVRTPPDESRLERWREELSDGELREAEQIAGPLLQELGYEVSK